jgi:hypothetical protein
MLDTFNLTTAPWPIEKFHMKPPPPSQVQSVAQNGTAAPSVARSNASSWAAVAATATAGNNRLVKFRPSDGIKRQVPEEPQSRPQPSDEDLRCVWIYGWTRGKPLSMVTDRIAAGAIFSMAYVEQYEAVCIIFQYASAAMQFMEEESQCLRDYGIGLFGKGHEIKYGEGFPENADLLRMQAPTNERRRLTFARQQLFTNGMNEHKFKKDLIDMVGSSNLELVWLFNTGNGMFENLSPHVDSANLHAQPRPCFHLLLSHVLFGMNSSGGRRSLDHTKMSRLGFLMTLASVP